MSLNLAKIILKYDTKAQATKEKIGKLDYIKKNIGASKDTIDQVIYRLRKNVHEFHIR